MKKEGAYSQFSEGESSSGSAQGEMQEVAEYPAFLLRDPWYTPSMFFPQVSYVFGDENPFDISLSSKDLKIIEKLLRHFGQRTTSSRGKLAWMGKWVMNLSQEKDKAVRRAGFLELWLSKFLFSEFSGYRIKSAFFPLAIRLAWGAQYPLAPMFLGHVYPQLDLLLGDEVKDNSCF
ncbi:hypothetical protein SO802_005563 [Lithocarpus litseifolius]|uniref:Aminotransferase-like plant mobile domain-containing protein n=1 Tax=Lithocarpus litseifolius TaxID=425828 RepID=A0AAW2DII1_9ROSI